LNEVAAVEEFELREQFYSFVDQFYDRRWAKASFSDCEARLQVIFSVHGLIQSRDQKPINNDQRAGTRQVSTPSEALTRVHATATELKAGAVELHHDADQ
jgi:hypothetical protein